MRDTASLKAAVAARVENLGAELGALADRIHAHPEQAYEERQAAAWLSSFLSDHGFEVRSGVGGVETAFLAHSGPAKAGVPTVAFLAEYDALPIVGHACGHNLIATMSAGAGLACLGLVPPQAGRIVVLGTPAEEGGGGKIRLLDAGAFDDVDAALMIHPWNRVRAHAPALGRMRFDVYYHGRSAHAASAPHKGINALDALILAFAAVAQLRQQTTPDTRIHGIVMRGGESPNVIPALTAGRFYVRAADGGALRALYDRVKACCEGAGQATGCRVEFQEAPSNVYEPVRENRTLVELFRRNLSSLGLEESAIDDEAAGSTDFGNVSQRLPGLHAYLAICEGDVDLHTAEFEAAAASERAKRTMRQGATLLAMTALDLLLDSVRLDRARAELALAPVTSGD